MHPAAEKGFAREAVRYHQGRPDYPAAINEWLRITLDLQSGRQVLELGAGTGKFTARLAATGAEVTALEPVKEMRKQITAMAPQARVIHGYADEIPAEDASFDVVVCAQSFHWFATAEVLKEVHRVLKPHGRLGLIWNVRDFNTQWTKALTDITLTYEDGAPQYRTGAWRKVFPAAGFGPLMESRFDHAHVGSPENVIVDRTLSISYIAALSSNEQQTVQAKIWDLIAKTPELAGRSVVSFPYETFAFWCEKQGARVS